MISPLAHVDPTAKIGNDVTIHPFAYVDAGVEIGDGCEIKPYTSIIKGSKLGKNVKVYQGSIIGADPQDFRWKGEETFCSIGDNTIVREHVIINRSIRAGESTYIGHDSFVMAESHIGHDCQVKGRCVIGNSVMIAGDAKIGECTILSSGAILHEKCEIGDWALIKGGCRISGNVPPYVIMAHNPAVYFGINATVLRKHNFTEEQIDDIAKSYRHIYQCGTSVFNALQRIEADVPDHEVRQKIVNFIREHDHKIVAIPQDFI